LSFEVEKSYFPYFNLLELLQNKFAFRCLLNLSSALFNPEVRVKRCPCMSTFSREAYNG